MKKFIYLLIFVELSFSTVAQENTIYVMIDSKYQSLYKFKKEINQDKNYYFSSIKILKDKSKNSGFVNRDFSKKTSDDIVIVKTQPTKTTFYEFESYKKPEILMSIDSLKLYNIKDISKNTKIFRDIWRNYKHSVVFIEKKKCKYVLWQMKPIYLE